MDRRSRRRYQPHLAEIHHLHAELRWHVHISRPHAHRILPVGHIRADLCDGPAAAAPPPPPPSGSTLTWESTGADTASITGIGPVEISGSTTVSPSQTTTYTGTFTGSTGTAICSATLTVQCNVGTAYSCSDQTIVRTDTDASCQTTVVNGATCTPPSFCSTG